MWCSLEVVSSGREALSFQRHCGRVAEVAGRGRRLEGEGAAAQDVVAEVNLRMSGKELGSVKHRIYSGGGGGGIHLRVVGGCASRM